MAILKLSNWSACRYIHSDLGPSGTKHVSLLVKCCYSIIQDVVIPEGFCVAVNGEKFWARIQHRYKRYTVIPNVIIPDARLYLMSLYPKFTAYELSTEKSH